ncbi:Uu.00g070020.m01.CDS01 [Anthostomella pinea]|uniref:Uu.00g070020.m01.CDS01 n=1 Tax=Anthostomella pinea TaxID=933095 RepID=A0AAI8VUL6_9PEZI|nr:Uu.00g070020.m01.CDS01 [Anthostomella pinea]
MEEPGRRYFLRRRPESIVHNQPEDDDTANEAELTTPPDSSTDASVNADMPGDEIVVGTHSNGDKPSPLRVVSDAEPELEAEDEDDRHVVAKQHKRKRASHFDELNEAKLETDSVVNQEVSRSRGVVRYGLLNTPHHVTLGYWRDTNAPSEQAAHAVIGFMDIRDRLRTRIQGVTRSNEPINTRLFPIPPGPGGSWVTFERVVFEPHLVGLDHNEIKEFVKVLTEAILAGDVVINALSDADAITEAKRRLAANPPADSPQMAQIAWGPVIPDNAVGRPEVKRRRVTNGVTTIADTARSQAGSQAIPPSPAMSQMMLPPHPQSQPQAALLGTRPTRILVGCWTRSAVENDRDRHAVYGILGANDMFRVKLVRETMDGNYMDGNFPVGAGALWISYDEVKFLPHIEGLSRPEMKEYVRVRQSQLDAGETEAERTANETKAVYEAQIRAAVMPKGPNGGNVSSRHSIGLGLEREDHHEGHKQELNNGIHESRHGRREMLPRNVHSAPQHGMAEPDLRQVSRHPSIESIERVQDLAAREVARMEAVQMRNERHIQSRGVMPNPNMMVDPMEHHRNFQENRDRMQRVWAAQEQNRIQQAIVEDAKMHQGVKYERKQTGHFAGKLVSQGTIISIDGEDYVEYRVLTKPSFF